MTASPFVWAGRALSGLITAFVAADALFKLAGRPDLLQAGIDVAAPPAALGASLLVAALLHALPRTALIGTILLTGALIASAAGQADPSRQLFAAYVVLLMWAGLVLRKPGLGQPVLRVIR
jgi:hypothetical protein